MTKLACGIICYNDGPGLKRLLDSIYEHVDICIVIDGKYPDYIGLEKFSTDGTDFIAQSYPNVDYHKASAGQEVKRTIYLEAAGRRDCEFLLVLDCDEYVTGDWKQFKKNLENKSKFEEYGKKVFQHIWNIEYQYEPDRVGCLPRLIYKPGLFRYITHYQLEHKTEGWLSSTAQTDKYFEMIPGIKIGNDDNLRPPERMEQDIEYQWYLFYKEGAISIYEYFNPLAKKKFADHIAYEYSIWKSGK